MDVFRLTLPTSKGSSKLSVNRFWLKRHAPVYLVQYLSGISIFGFFICAGIMLRYVAEMIHTDLKQCTDHQKTYRRLVQQTSVGFGKAPRITTAFHRAPVDAMYMKQRLLPDANVYQPERPSEQNFLQFADLRVPMQLAHLPSRTKTRCKVSIIPVLLKLATRTLCSFKKWLCWITCYRA